MYEAQVFQFHIIFPGNLKWASIHFMKAFRTEQAYVGEKVWEHVSEVHLESVAD